MAISTTLSTTTDGRDWEPIEFKSVLNDDSLTLTNASKSLVEHITKHPESRISFSLFGAIEDIPILMTLKPMMQNICDTLNNHFSKNLQVFNAENMTRLSISDSQRTTLKNPVDALKTVSDTILQLCSPPKK